MNSDAPSTPWYHGVTRYQWLVLAVASAGWIFDAFEGQIFNVTRDDMLREIIGPDRPAQIKRWGEWFLAIFLLGGTFGGVLFGSLADRFGRKPTMALTILFYSIFSGLTYFATDLWHVAVLRFLVAVGVGGEWAVAAALVAEVFPPRARARAAGIFHGSSVVGLWLAALAGLLVNTDWRMAYLIGVIPALLVLWVRVTIEEPERWKHAESQHQARGRFRDLFGEARWAKPAILGMLLATVGLGTFWGVVIEGQGLTRDLLIRNIDPAVDGEQRKLLEAEARQKAKIAYGWVQSLGAGVGMISFGWIASWIGRRGAFAIMHVGALVWVPLTCYLPQSYAQMLLMLPLYGFFTLGIHAGYAVYFPELFPDRLRATGTGVCFNGGRLLAAGVLVLSGELKAIPGMTLPNAVAILSSLFLLGLVLLVFLPETKGRPLPE